MERVTSWAAASLMLHECSGGGVEGSVMDARPEMVRCKKRPILTNSERRSHLEGHGDRPRTHLQPKSLSVSTLHKNPESRKGDFHLFPTPVSPLRHSRRSRFCHSLFIFFQPPFYSGAIVKWLSHSEGTHLLPLFFRAWHFTTDVRFEYALAVSVKADRRSAAAGRQLSAVQNVFL